MPSETRTTSRNVFNCGARLTCLNKWTEDGDTEEPYGNDENVLRVVKTDLKLGDNGQSHRTWKYDLMRREKNPNLVVRRGQQFKIDVTFNRPLDSLTDLVSFVFSNTKKETAVSLNRGTRIPLTSGNENFETSSGLDEWGATIEQVIESTITIVLKTSSKCPIGKWTVSLDTEQSKSSKTHNFPHPIYILFNPWNESDEVYFPEEDGRTEYVMEDTGLIWQGTHNRLRPVPWAYSQFESVVLDCALELLDKRTSAMDKASGIKICRALSALVNSNDDDGGILDGKWSGDFNDGTHPTKWNGSFKILQQYFSRKKSVKYGQCWIFAGVLTTICRALGIPSRPVTNFSSAHDTQSSMTIDYVFDDQGQPVEDMNQDSVWNFHVWSEVWLQRDDLNSEGTKLYDGWQAIDATPQELSNGMFRLGPASVAACKRGEIKRPHDVDFLFSEVNADKVYWRYIGPKKPLKFLALAPDAQSAIGLHISTKAIGKFEREDITENYKYPEKSAEEREAMLTALRLSSTSFSRFYLNEEFSPVKFDLKLPDDVVIGAPFRILLTIENQSEKDDYEIGGFLRVNNILYTGAATDIAIKKHFDVAVPFKTRRHTEMTVSYEDYSKKMTDQAAFNVACIAKVKESGFEFFTEIDFRVRKPDIKFQMPNEKTILLGEPFTVTASLLNPLPVKLTTCQFRVDAPGFGEPLKIKLKNTIKIGEKAEAKFQLTPSVEGGRTITVGFTSKELQHVDGFVTCQVQPNKNDTMNEL